MKWGDVSYILHEWPCSVLFDEPEWPGLVKRYDGIIDCASPGAIPILRNSLTIDIMSPPPWATVVLHSPTRMDHNWPYNKRPGR